MTPSVTRHGPWCYSGRMCPTCLANSLTEEEIARKRAVIAQWQSPHICNYASRYRPTLCRRTVTDGERYCSQHR